MWLYFTADQVSMLRYQHNYFTPYLLLQLLDAVNVNCAVCNCDVRAVAMVLKVMRPCVDNNGKLLYVYITINFSVLWCKTNFLVK